MKVDNKLQFKEIFVIICIVILMILFGVNIYSTSHENIKNEEQRKEYTSICSRKQNQINNLKEKILNKNEIKNGSYNNPYLPDGFKHLEGNWNDGYVIQDENGNEFVWVPCKIYINDDVLELKRYNFDILDNILTDKCYENLENVEEFIKSVGKYEGFYIARYEAGKEKDSAVSKKGKDVYTNVSYNEAYEISKNMYKGNGIHSSLMNSLAWDTTLKWIDKTTSSKYSSKGSYTSSNANDLQKTGYDSINKIYDLSGNACEITTEKYYENCIYRGGYIYNNRENKRSPGFRDSVLSEDKSNNIGFRVILYLD